MTGLVPWATLPAAMKTGEGIRVTGVNNKGGINPIDDAAILSMLDRLDELYRVSLGSPEFGENKEFAGVPIGR